MLYIFSAIAGAALLATGFFIGRKAAGGSLRETRARENEADESKRESTLALRAAAEALNQAAALQKTAPAPPVSEEEQERMREFKKQWDNMMAYTGEVQREDKK